jgi:CheY-like chemotaxis protein
VSDSGRTNGDRTVLIVEDEDAIRLTLRDYLTKRNYRVLPASDGVGAIKMLLDHRVDAIVTDYRMELLGGDYWMKFLETYCSAIPVIVTSGFLRPEFPIPFPVLYKPFDYDELEKMIRERIAENTGGGGV